MLSDILNEILSRLEGQFASERIGEAVVSLATNLMVGMLTFGIFYLMWRILDRALRMTLERARLEETTAAFMKTALKYTVLTIGAVQALSVSGVDTAAVLASLGVVGLSVGFAARDALSNLISGLLIFWDRPFVIGDLIEIGGDYGRVENITLRSTRIVTIDGRMLAVPNSVIINSSVASYTNFPHLRLDVDVAVATTENIGLVRSILLALVDEDADIMNEPEPRVVVKALNDYNILVQLQVWLDDERHHIQKRFELREKMFSALRKAGVHMPLETIQLAPFRIHPSEPTQSA